MQYDRPGRSPDSAHFRKRLAAIAPDFDCDEELLGAAGPLGRPFSLRDRELSNRFAIHPMEGWDGEADGAPSERTLRRWRGFGRSGAAVIWGGEAVAVTAEGRAQQKQLCLQAGANPQKLVDDLRQALDEGRAQAGAEGTQPWLGLQLTHSGRHARPEPRPAAPHPVLDARLPRPGRLLEDGELEELIPAYVQAARVAREAGFDFVDVKACHGYLLHELLGARTRPGLYGGDLAGRARLLLTIIDTIRSEVPGIDVGVRLSIADVFPHGVDPETGEGTQLGWDDELPWPYGFGHDLNDPRRTDLSETVQLLRWLVERDVLWINASFSSPYASPHLSRPASAPPFDGYPVPEDPLLSVYRHLQAVRALRAAVPEVILVGSGYSYLQEYLPHVAQYEVGHDHVNFVGLGRLALIYPDLPRDVLHQRPLERRRLCRTFSDCTNAPRIGLQSGCYPLDSEYKDHPDHQLLRAAKISRQRTPQG